LSSPIIKLHGYLYPGHTYMYLHNYKQIKLIETLSKSINGFRKLILQIEIEIAKKSKETSPASIANCELLS